MASFIGTCIGGPLHMQVRKCDGPILHVGRMAKLSALSFRLDDTALEPISIPKGSYHYAKGGLWQWEGWHG